MEKVLGDLLLWGAIIASLVVLVGGTVYLFRHSSEVPDYSTFHGVPSQFRSLPQIFESVLAWRGRGIIQLGLILLILTPVARVLLSIFFFLKQRDWVYVGVTVFVLIILVYGLAGGQV